MKIGISRPPTPPYPLPDVDAAIVARHAEALGFESMFYGEHTIRPVDQPGMGVHRDGIPFFQDTLVALARASAVTTRLKVGGGIFLAPQHHPLRWAKELASLDLYSEGRLIVGVGVGWSRLESEMLGANFDRRWAQTEETVQLMRALWSGAEIEHHGAVFTFPRVQCFPTPASPSGPPVLLAARPGVGFDRVVRWADGWLPAYVTRQAIESGPADVAAARRVLDDRAEIAGRDPATISITAIVRGDADVDLVHRFEDAGAERVAVSLPTVTNEPEVKAALERIAERLLGDEGR